MPDGDVPGEVELPGVPGLAGVFGLAGVPGFVADPPAAPGVPGKGPHGEPVGLCPGFVFGFTVEGVVPLPGVGGLVEFAPGTVDGTVVLPGGVVVLGVGVAVPGVRLCPGTPAPLAGEAPPDGAFCATIQLAHNRSNERKVSLAADIGSPPSFFS